MRVAVLSDVHANLRALHAVCADIQRAGIENVWCLGDFASGGGEPAECFDLTIETATVVLAGNHEQFVTGRVWEILDGGWARQARRAHAALGPARVETLRALPPHRVLPNLGVELVHGSLVDPWSGFVHDAASAEATLARSSQPLVLAGHTHRAAHFRERPARADPRPPPSSTGPATAPGAHSRKPRPESASENATSLKLSGIGWACGRLASHRPGSASAQRAQHQTDCARGYEAMFS